MLAVAFQNRNDELLLFGTEIRQRFARPRVVFLIAPTGIGKSAFAARLIETNPDMPAVRVRVPSGQEQIAEAGHYLRLLAKALHQNAQGWETFPAFARRLTPTVWKTLANAVLADFGGYAKAPATTGVYATRAFGLGDFDIDRVFQTAATEVVGALQAYVATVLKDRRLIINIENVQMIDEFSLNAIAAAIRATHDHYLLLEFTENAPGRELTYLRQTFANEGCDVVQRALRRLPAHEAIQLLSKQPRGLETFFENAYAESDGNLRPLADLSVQIDLDAALFDQYASGAKVLEEATRDNIRGLRPDDQFLLVVIAMNEGAAHTGDLRMLHELAAAHALTLDLDQGLDRLSARKLVERAEDLVRVKHDQVLDAAARDPRLERYRVIANEFWKAFYTRALDEPAFFISRSEALLQSLVFAYRTNDDGRLFELIDEVGVQALRTRAPERLLSYVRQLRRKLAEQPASTKITRALHGKLLQVSYEIGQFEFAAELVPEDPANPIEILYRAALLDLRDRQEQAIAYIDQQLAQSDEPWFTLMLQLVKLSALRGSNQHTRCRRLFRDLIADARYRTLPSYGSLLRSADLALPPFEAIPYIESAVGFYSERADVRATAYARIALSLSLGDVGRLDHAERELRTALDELAGKVAETHTILNNLAAIRLYRRQFDRETLETLQFAKATASEHFDRLVITMNTMIALTYAGALSEAAASAREIHDLITSGKPRELEIRRIAFFNLSRYCHAARDAILERTYLHEAAAIDIDWNRELWDYRLRGTPITDPAFVFRAQFDFYPAFLTYWHPSIAGGVPQGAATL